MFVPPHFAESNLATLHNLIEQNSFGLLISQVEGEPFATHLPFLLERKAGPNGTLIGHVARANPHWKGMGGQNSLAIFTGPHAYISPTWYETENVVPTWNYVAVHAYGKIELIEDRDSLLQIVKKSVFVYEADLPKPWTLDESSNYVERMLGQIVGFQMEIERIEGKWKLNQNHPKERRAKVVRALREQRDENSLGIADLMQEMLTAKE